MATELPKDLLRIRGKWDLMAEVTWNQRPLIIQQLSDERQKLWLAMTLNMVAEEIIGNGK